MDREAAEEELNNSLLESRPLVEVVSGVSVDKIRGVAIRLLAVDPSWEESRKQGVYLLFEFLH